MAVINYWFTTHWPPRIRTKRDPNGIWLAEGRQAAGTELKPNDIVYIYETATARDEIQTKTDGSFRTVRSIYGVEGVFAICRVTRELASDGLDKETKYTDGSRIWWRWYAPTEIICTSGFVSRIELNKILKFKPGNRFRAAGTLKSGLKKLTVEEFDKILCEFRKGEGKAKRHPRSSHPGTKGGGESDAHRWLKEFVASNPEKHLGEIGLVTDGVEFEFPSHDRADLYLHDRFGRVIGAEVEVDVGPAEVVGPLQALKYKVMLEFLAERPKNEGRAFLIAYSISKKIIDKCEKYGIEHFTIDRDIVYNWVKSKSG